MQSCPRYRPVQFSFSFSSLRLRCCRLCRLPRSSLLSSSSPSYSLSSLSSPSLSRLVLIPHHLDSSSRVATLRLWSRPYPIPHISSRKNHSISPTGHLYNLEPTPNPILPAPRPTIHARSRRWHFTAFSPDGLFRRVGRTSSSALYAFVRLRALCG